MRGGIFVFTQVWGAVTPSARSVVETLGFVLSTLPAPLMRTPSLNTQDLAPVLHQHEAVQAAPGLCSAVQQRVPHKQRVPGHCSAARPEGETLRFPRGASCLTADLMQSVEGTCHPELAAVLPACVGNACGLQEPFSTSHVAQRQRSTSLAWTGNLVEQEGSCRSRLLKA